jgi:hypothetical protein
MLNLYLMKEVVSPLDLFLKGTGGDWEPVDRLPQADAVGL